jgi:hypothetical protein
MRRHSLLLLLAAVFGLSAFWIHDRTPQERLVAASADLQARIDLASKALAAEAATVLHADTMAIDSKHAPGEVGFRFFRDSVVTAWSDHAPVSDTALFNARGRHLALSDGVYLHAFAARGATSVHALRRVWFRPPFENTYLQNHFDPGFTLNKGVVAEQGPGMGTVVRDADGNVMFRLQWRDDSALPGTRSLVSLICAFAAILCAVAALWRFAAALPGTAPPLLLFLSVLLGARLATLAHGSFDALTSFPLFDPSLFASSFFMPSLGDLLINVAVLLCAALFTHRMLSRSSAQRRPWRWAVAAVMVLYATASAAGGVMIALVHDSNVPLNLFRVQNLDGYSLAALLAIGLLLAAWCILAHALIRPLATALPPARLLLLAVVAAAVLALANHLSGNYDLVLAAWPLPVLLLLYRIRRQPGIIPFLALIAMLALFTAHVLNRQTLKRTELDRDTLAENATTREDPVVELLFGEAAREMGRDAALVRWAQGGTPCTSVDLDRLVRQPYFSGYWDRFDLRVHLVSTAGRYCSTSPDAPSSALAIEDRFQQGVPVAAHNNLRITDRPGEDALYIGRLNLGASVLYVEIRLRLVADGLGFPELLLAGDRPSSMKPGLFVRAR